MAEHKKLKEICDVIGYWGKNNRGVMLYADKVWNSRDEEFETQIDYIDVEWYEDSIYEIANVREIIFTQEFMDRLINHKSTSLDSLYKTQVWLLSNLDNPVDYLYKLIINKEEEWNK